MNEVNKDHVYQLYDKIYDWFDSNRTRALIERDYLERVLHALADQATILDLGCGAADPIAAFFIARGHAVVGVDASERMLLLAKQRFPEQEWLLQDMRQCNLGRRFDAIFAWDSFFHLPHDDQRHMFSVFQAHADSGAMLLFTSGPFHGEVVSPMNGYDFYHASLSEEEYRTLLDTHGFEVVLYRPEDEECGGHTVWLARYVGNV